MGQTSLIAVAPDGTIWVPDGETSRIRIFAPDGKLLEVWGDPGTGEGQFDFSWTSYTGYSFGAIAFDAAGNFYVVDSGNHRIQKFGPDRRFLTAWGSEGRGDGQFFWASDVAVDAQGRVFVLDGGHWDPSAAPDGTFVQVFDGDGRFLFDWGPGGREPDKLHSSWGIDIDPDGNVLIADGDLNRIQRFTPEGVHLQTLDGAGTDGVKFLHPTDVAVDEQGLIYVTEWYGNQVTVLGSDGRVLATWGERGEGEGQFVNPYGLALDGQGNVYVTDYVTSGGRLQALRIVSLPEPVAALDPAADVATEPAASQSDIEANTALVLRYLTEVWDQGNTDVVFEVLAPDFTWQTNSQDPAIAGPEAAQSRVESIRASNPGMAVTVDIVAAEGDYVTIRWSMTTPEVVAGTPQPEPRLVCTANEIYRIEAGMIAEVWQETVECPWQWS
jgi:sugar lactone lactonase YvrE